MRDTPGDRDGWSTRNPTTRWRCSISAQNPLRRATALYCEALAGSAAAECSDPRDAGGDVKEVEWLYQRCRVLRLRLTEAQALTRRGRAYCFTPTSTTS